MSEQILGFDLGTTNSSVAINTKSHDIEIVPNERGEKLTPSVVKFGANKVTVGQSALNSAVAEPERVVSNVKRKMGTEWSYEAPDGHNYSPQEISAFILKELKAAAEQRLNQEVDQAVIAVPARFEAAAREATKSAGDIAGFDDVTLITEPEAAVLSEFKTGNRLQGTVMTADTGGGTVDISILDVSRSDIITKTTEGNIELGGIDFTDRLVEKVKEQTGEIENPDFKQEMIKRSEAAKIDLSTQEEVTISVPTSNDLVKVKFNRQQFDEETQPERDKILKVCETALNSLEMEWNDISELLLVGGTSKIPAIQQMFTEILGPRAHFSTWPDEAVVIGAGIKAADIMGRDILTEAGTLELPPSHQPVLSRPVGVEAVEGESGEAINKIILEKDSLLPVEGTETFTTKEDRQTNVGITLLEGKSRFPSNCKVLGEEDGQVLKNIPPQPAGQPQIELTLEMNEEGILTGKAVELNSGSPVEFQLSLPQLLSNTEKEAAEKRTKNLSSNS